MSSLTLYSQDNVSLAHAELLELLKSIELTGKPLGPFQFLAGRRFFNHITFLGCAPNIAVLPEHGPQYIRLSIPPLSKPKLFAGARAPAPLCPACKQPLENWRARIESAENRAVSCLQCHKSTPIEQLNFRKRTCFSQNIIRIEPIFESEAIPGNSLLDTLNNAFNANFRYAYIGSE